MVVVMVVVRARHSGEDRPLRLRAARISRAHAQRGAFWSALSLTSKSAGGNGAATGRAARRERRRRRRARCGARAPCVPSPLHRRRAQVGRPLVLGQGRLAVSEAPQLPETIRRASEAMPGVGVRARLRTGRARTQALMPSMPETALPLAQPVVEGGLPQPAVFKNRMYTICQMRQL